MMWDLSETEVELNEKFRALSAASKTTVMISVRLAVMEGQAREQAIKRLDGEGENKERTA